MRSPSVCLTGEHKFRHPPFVRSSGPTRVAASGRNPPGLATHRIARDGQGCRYVAQRDRDLRERARSAERVNPELLDANPAPLSGVRSLEELAISMHNRGFACTIELVRRAQPRSNLIPEGLTGWRARGRAAIGR